MGFVDCKCSAVSKSKYAELTGMRVMKQRQIIFGSTETQAMRKHETSHA
jgi:hypothetical protein